jgi:hypothetical protein
MAELLEINNGQAPGDDLGEWLYYAFGKCKTNFSLLKNLQGPCVGTRYLDVRLAVKAFSVRFQYLYDNFYISKIITGLEESGQFRYTIEVSKSLSFLLAGTVVMSYTHLEALEKSTVENIYLGEANSSGLWGKILIDWSLLRSRTTYIMTLPGEGYLFVVNSIRDQASSPGGGGINPTLTDGGTIPGNVIFYENISETAVSVTLIDIVNIPGVFTIKNSGTGVVTIHAASNNQLIDGFVTIYLAKREWIQIIPSNGYHTAIGIYTGDEPST